MPIQPIGEKGRKGEFGSPYSISDYYAVDPNYGTLADFKNLVAEPMPAASRSSWTWWRTTPPGTV